ncbi:MAG: hypothetical protein GY765_25470 [bacterium]|nr:hypothetical protein [bacterium]
MNYHTYILTKIKKKSIVCVFFKLFKVQCSRREKETNRALPQLDFGFLNPV